jgi:ornithine cyclodeaminase/alanine dehydrogenase-like protein (mu-crystallin family)
VAAIFGAGPQGRTQLQATCAVRDIETAYIYEPTQERAEAYVKDMAGAGNIPTDVRIATSPAEAIANADIICTATGSTRPVFDDTDLKPGAHISAIGAYTPEMQEIPIETVARSRIVVDSRATVMDEAGDIVKAMQAGLIDASSIHAELGEIVLGLQSGRQADDEITFFKSVGNAVQDAVAAQVALKNAHVMKLGIEVEF